MNSQQKFTDRQKNMELLRIFMVFCWFIVTIIMMMTMIVMMIGLCIDRYKIYSLGR